jgi:hypothetical protein
MLLIFVWFKAGNGISNLELCNIAYLWFSEQRRRYFKIFRSVHSYMLKKCLTLPLVGIIQRQMIK